MTQQYATMYSGNGLIAIIAVLRIFRSVTSSLFGSIYNVPLFQGIPILIVKVTRIIDRVFKVAANDAIP